MKILDRPSPNHGARRGCDRPDMILIHHTAMETAAAAIERLCDPETEVSAHYVISENGQVTRLVAEERRAWHAGVGQWGAVTDINSHSIGIELANPASLGGFPPFPEPQMAALEALIADTRMRWEIPPERVLGHSDTAPGRKFDPGPKFDWRRLARSGHAIWPAPVETGASEWSEFKRAAHRAGYREPEQGWEAVLEALRLRFRPWALNAPLDAEDIAIVEGLPEETTT
ncbi:N-acetylmuramoyl-L-alanine amidase [Amaricoccus macauensis]|uniref:N-acetylmuramoyl-L-alanine amidase n=1 Tax=Amaricoccus macauensis TaxID=57001 RepID=UPI003C7C22D3